MYLLGTSLSSIRLHIRIRNTQTLQNMILEIFPTLSIVTFCPVCCTHDKPAAAKCFVSDAWPAPTRYHIASLFSETPVYVLQGAHMYYQEHMRIIRPRISYFLFRTFSSQQAAAERQKCCRESVANIFYSIKAIDENRVGVPIMHDKHDGKKYQGGGGTTPGGGGVKCRVNLQKRARHDQAA